MIREDICLTHDHTLNAQLLRNSYFKPDRGWLIAPRGVPYLNWLLVPVQHPQGWVLEVHSPNFGICTDCKIYPNPEAAIEAGPEFVQLWYAQYTLLDISF